MPHTALRAAEIRDLVISEGRRLRVRCWTGTGVRSSSCTGCSTTPRAGRSSPGTRTARATPSTCPGFGASSLPTRPRISAYAEAIVAALDQLDVDGCTLVGHSLGGAVATAVAERTDKVWALALLAPAGFGHIRMAEAVSCPASRTSPRPPCPLALVNPLTVTAAYTTFVAHRQLPSKDLMDRLRRRAFSSGPGSAWPPRRSPPPAAPSTASRTAGSTSTARSPRSGASTTRSCAPSTSTALRRALPQAHVEVWRGMGHHPQRERPAELTRFIEAHAVTGRTRRRPVLRVQRAA